jgi:ATP-dependent Lon protease
MKSRRQDPKKPFNNKKRYRQKAQTPKPTERLLNYKPNEKKTIKEIICEVIVSQLNPTRHVAEDLHYLKTLPENRQITIVDELEQLMQTSQKPPPVLMSLLEKNVPFETKKIAYKKISTLNSTSPGSSEYVKLKSWVDAFLQVPFGKYTSLPVTCADGQSKCEEFIESTNNILNNTIFGHNDTKLQLLELIGQWMVNPDSVGNAIAIHGPPGTGKTSLVKNGISKILGRPFTFISLGGSCDGSLLEGHGYTYEGSTCGRIIQTLIDCQCMNPVFYFDELDKVSATPKGEEVNAILAKLTDPSQNSEFHDRYFSGIKFDMSRCLFVFSYNDDSKINPILKDRLRKIYTCGYTTDEKTTIATDYIIPRTALTYLFNPNDVQWSPEIIHHIISRYCSQEEGVREMKRCIEKIFSILNLSRLSPNNVRLKPFQLSPLLTKDIVNRLLDKKSRSAPESWNALYC